MWYCCRYGIIFLHEIQLLIFWKTNPFILYKKIKKECQKFLDTLF